MAGAPLRPAPSCAGRARLFAQLLRRCSYVQTGVYGGQGGAGLNKVASGGATQVPPPPPPAPPPQPGPGPGAADPPIGRNDPYFDSNTPRNVTALVGKSAYLSCRVRNLGNRTSPFTGRHQQRF
ncbi:Uncharacterized protein GBIM_15888 [Gryllus bimaculatus]|nr:Uncharacterized protein GBIM_15888 [Gryllus bimaculatus]